jgi:hypothetical protein
MPTSNYAPWGNAIFGETVWGSPPSSVIGTTLTVTPYYYDTLGVRWTPINGILGQVLMRSSYGTPTSIFDGEPVLAEYQQATPQGFSSQFIDTNLQSGLIYYYALFALYPEQATPQIDEYVIVGAAQGLVLTDYGFEDLFAQWLPQFYLAEDIRVTGPTGALSAPLRQFLGLLGFEMNWIRSEIETLVNLNNGDLVSGVLLPVLGANFGMGYEPELGMTRSRVLVKNAVFLYKNKGTAIGVEAAASAFSGYGAQVTIGGNLEIQLDDCAFDESTGHWQPLNNGTTLGLISSAAAGVTPQHATVYSPVPLALPIATAGYLPVNNENMMIVTAGGAFTWTRQSLTTSPAARAGAGIAVANVLGNVVLFGGLLASGNPAGDTWVWNGTTWVEQAPAASPPARMYTNMTHDPTASLVYLFGGIDSSGSARNDFWSWNGTTWAEIITGLTPPERSQAVFRITSGVDSILFGGMSSSGGVLNDTWQWNETAWTQLNPVTSPTPRAGAAYAYDSGRGVLVVFGGMGATGDVLNDVWEWSGTTWNNVTPSTGPFPKKRMSANMSYDATLGVTVLFGGNDNDNDLFTDSWTWNGTEWVLLPAVVSPLPRTQAMMVYDSSAAGMLLFGGITGFTTLSGSGGSSLSSPTLVSDTWVGSDETYQAVFSTCTPFNAPVLGIPIPADGQEVSYYVHVQPDPANVVLQEFFAQLDWYGQNGVLISSTVGASVTEVAGEWKRLLVPATAPPPGAITYGRTVSSVGTLAGDNHLFDAIGSGAVPLGSTWTPPRDIQVNLFPVRQNSIPNPVGLGGTYGWTASVGGIASSSAPVIWPVTTSGGFVITSNGAGAFSVSTGELPVNDGKAYSFSCYLRPVTLLAENVTISVSFYNKSNVLLSSTPLPLEEFAEEAGVFTQFQLINQPAPSTAQYAIVTLAGSASGPASHYLGAVLFEASAAVLPYFDANFNPATDYLFEGTPNQSPSDYYPKLEVRLARLVEALPDYIPIGSTFSLFIGASAFANAGLNG